MNSWIIVIFCAILLVSVDSWNSEQLYHQVNSSTTCPEICTCNNVTKVVRCVNVHLQEVPPDLPTYTEQLIIYGNRIEALNESSFSATPYLQHLDIRLNKIKTIGKNSFLPLAHLAFLDFTSNPTNDEVLSKGLFCGLHSTSIKKLILSPPRKSDNITSNFFECLRNTTLESLVIVGNSATPFSLADNALSHFHNLKELRIEKTKIYKFNTMALSFDTQLRTLSLQKNNLIEVPVFMNTKTKKGIIPQLEHLDLSKNSIQSLNKYHFQGLFALKVLILSHNLITNIEKSFFSSLPSLRYLYLNNNNLQKLNENSFQSTNIIFLQLENNNLEIKNNNRNLYRNMKHIEYLYLSDSFNVIEGVFENITSLRLLSLKGIKITQTAEIPRSTLIGLYNLQTLYIAKTKVGTLDRMLFRDLYSLKKLYLFGNQITTVNITSFPQHVWQTVELLAMAGNNFMCTCDLLWFIDWVKDNRNKVENIEGTRCKYPHEEKDVPITKSKVSADLCIKKPISAGTKTALGLSLVMSLTAIAISGMIRHRWYLRSKLFHLTVWMEIPKVKQRNMEQTQEFTFDVFVSYNSEDSQWVNTALVNELEVRCEPPYKLCLYERDWIAGHSIIDCIGESIEQSRKILLIVTNAFAESQWCQLELTMAQHRLLETDNDNVIVAIMEDIEPANMTPTLALEMKRRVYLEWTEDELGQRLFWQKLKRSLASDNSCIRRAMPPRELL